VLFELTLLESKKRNKATEFRNERVLFPKAAKPANISLRNLNDAYLIDVA
jgi:hypothetical protein